MASSGVASSSLPYASGNVVVVTQTLPAAPNGEQRADGRHRFRRGHPKALGAVQIMIGLMTLLFGIVAAASHYSLGVYSGIFVWGSLIYVASGSVTVAAEKSVSRCLINASLTLNVIAAIVAIPAVILYAVDTIVSYEPHDYDDPYDPYDDHHDHDDHDSHNSHNSHNSHGSFKSNIHYYYPGYSAVLAVFQFLQLIVSIVVAAYACNATCSCSCCMQRPQTFVQTVDNPAIPQAHFQAASMAPAQPHPQAAPDFKNPEDLSSDDPPPYQFNPT